jgi:hypothetical protein
MSGQLWRKCLGTSFGRKDIAELSAIFSTKGMIYEEAYFRSGRGQRIFAECPCGTGGHYRLEHFHPKHL